MSTIYTFHAECSTVDTLAVGDEFLIYDASTGRTVTATSGDIATYVGSSPTLTTPTINGGTFAAPIVFTCLSSQSILVGTTFSARIGFFGHAGTSAASFVATTSATATNPTTCTGAVGFNTTQAATDTIALVNALQAVAVNLGLMKPS